MSLSALALAALAVSLLLMTGVWVASLVRRDASLVDRFWGPAFVAIAWLGFAFGDGDRSRSTLVLVLAAVWGLRLAVHISWRNWGKGEDPRYRAMRERGGKGWAQRSLVTVFALQGALATVIALPLLVAQSAPRPPGLGPLDYAGAALWLAGFLCEAIADWQLARFKADPAHRGQVMDRGLWRYSRHPNYFGEALLWWGFFFIAAAVPGGVWTIFSPLLMTFLLLRVSGVALLERGLVASKPQYADYVARTSAFVPWPPR